MGCFSSKTVLEPSNSSFLDNNTDSKSLPLSQVLPSGSRRPSYWRNQSSDLDVGFDEKISVGDESKETKDFIERLFLECSSATALGCTVKKVLRIEDSVMWVRYQETKSLISLKRSGNCTPAMDIPQSRGQVITKALIRNTAAKENSTPAHSLVANLDMNLNEYYLWHGTSEKAWKAIAEDGFKFDENSARPGRYGRGVYFAEDSSKSLEYCVPVEDNYRYMLLCRVILGEFYLTNEDANDDAGAIADALGMDGLLAAPSNKAPREFVVYDTSRVYPEYALLLEKD